MSTTIPTPFSFPISVQGKEYTCVLERCSVPRKSQYKCAGFWFSFAGNDFAVLMSFVDKHGHIAYQQSFCGSDAISLLNRYQSAAASTMEELWVVPFDVRFVKRMAKRAMTTRLESLRINGKAQAAYGWSISNGRKRTTPTTR